MPIDRVQRGRRIKRLLMPFVLVFALSGCTGEVSSDPTILPSTPVMTSPAPVQVEPVEVAYPALMPSIPTRIRIPAIEVDSDLISLGLHDDGTMEVPSEGFPAGWFTGAPTPGELGPAIIAGHVDWTTGPGVFYDLHRTSAGDEIIVEREDGTTATFVVDTVEQFSKDDFPTQRVYENLNHSGLRLITCGGAFDKGTGHYVDNIVVFAKLKV